MKALISILLCFAVTSVTHAQESSAQKLSDFSKSTPTMSSTAKMEKGDSSVKNEALSTANFTPAAGKVVIQVSPKMVTTTSSADIAGGRYSTEARGTVTEIQWLHRVGALTTLEVSNDLGNLEAETRFKKGNTTDKTTYTASGLGDFRFTLRSMRPADFSVFHYGLTAAMSNGASEIGDKTVDGNRKSGGNTLTPFLSYEVLEGNRVIGGRASLALNNDKSLEFRSRQSVTRIQSTGGNVLSFGGFSEKTYGQGLLGAALDLNLVGAANWQAANGKNIGFDPHQSLHAKVYGETRLTNQSRLIPSLGYVTLFGPSSNIGESSELILSLSARISL